MRSLPGPPRRLALGGLPLVLPSLFAAASMLLPLPAQRPPDRPGFRAYLWTHADRVADDDLPRALRDGGFRGIALEAGGGRKQPPVGIQGFYLDQIVKDGILHLDEEPFFDALKTSLETPESARRPRCLRSPEVRADARRQIEKAILDLAGARPDFVSLRDEPSMTRLLNPFDGCRCVGCEQAFLGFVRDRWGGLDKAARAWGATSADGPPGVVRGQDGGSARLAIPTTADARRRFFHGTRPPEALVPWNDARDFEDAGFAEALSEFTRAVPIGGEVPAGVLGAQMPSAFGGFDWERLLAAVDVVEPYDHGGVREMIRSWRTPRSRVFHTYFPVAGAPLATAHELWHYFLHGDDGAIVFSDRDFFRSERPLARTPFGGAFAAALKDLENPAFSPFRTAPEAAPEVAVLASMPSIRAQWMLDSREDGATWPRRLTSVEIERSNSGRSRAAVCALLEDLGLRYAFVTPADLRRGALFAGGFAALVLPRALAMAPEEIQAVRAFAEGGRVVIADGHVGRFNHRLREYGTSPADALFGVRRSRDDLFARPPNTRGEPDLPYPPLEPNLAAVGARALRSRGGTPVLLANLAASGLDADVAITLNLDLGEYLRDRILDQARAAWIRDQLRPFLSRGRTRSVFHVNRGNVSTSWPTEIIVRDDGRDRLVAVQLNLRPSASFVRWDDPSLATATEVMLSLPGTFDIEDVGRGISLGRAGSVRVEVRVDRPALLRLSR